MEYLKIDDFLHLERIKPAIAQIIFDAIDNNRSFLREWLPFVDQTNKVEDTEAFINSVNNKMSSESDDIFSIWFKGKFVGLIGYKESDRINNKTELGYWMIEEFQGNGIMTKAVHKLTDFAFRSLRMNRVQIKTALGNVKSSAIPKRLNYHFEGIEREGEKHFNKYLNLEVYSILKKDWFKSVKNV